VKGTVPVGPCSRTGLQTMTELDGPQAVCRPCGLTGPATSQQVILAVAGGTVNLASGPALGEPQSVVEEGPTIGRVLGRSTGEGMSAVAAGHEEEVVVTFRAERGRKRPTSGVADRSGRQTDVEIGVVG
jgi:hypothetical protein